jgi:hypothetical protein
MSEIANYCTWTFIKPRKNVGDVATELANIQLGSKKYAQGSWLKKSTLKSTTR